MNLANALNCRYKSEGPQPWMAARTYVQQDSFLDILLQETNEKDEK